MVTVHRGIAIGGPEDPDEEEDIDKKGAYLHFEIKVAPWIYWTTNFEI